MKILHTILVEDNEVLRSGLVTFLYSLPYVTVVGAAKDGEEAIKYVDDLDPDLLLLDLRMPKLDGWQVLRCLQDRQARTKVIVFSAYATSYYVSGMQRHDGIVYIDKGNPLALVSAIAELANSVDEANS